MEEKKKRKNPKRLACIIKCIHGKKKRENKYDRVTEKRSKTLLVLGAENTATKENRKTVAPLEGLGGPGRAAVRRIRGGPRPRGFSDVFRSVAAAAHCRGVFVRRNRDGARVQRIPPPSGHDDNNSTGGLVVNIIYSFFSEISFFFFCLPRPIIPLLAPGPDRPTVNDRFGFSDNRYCIHRGFGARDAEHCDTDNNANNTTVFLSIFSVPRPPRENRRRR